MTFDGASAESNQSSLLRSENASRQESNLSSSSIASSSVGGLGTIQHIQQGTALFGGKQPTTTTTASIGQLESTQPRPAYLRYRASESTADECERRQNPNPHLLARQVNWNFYSDCKDDYRRSVQDICNGTAGPGHPSFPLLPQTEEALKLLQEIDGNIAAVGGFGENGFGILLDDNNGIFGDGSGNRDDNMSYYLRNGARASFFNQPSGETSQTAEPKSDCELREPETFGAAAAAFPSTSSSSSSAADRMLKRPTFASNVPPSSLSGFGNSKPVAGGSLAGSAGSGLYQAQPPRIIGSTSANFGASPTVINHKITIEPPTSATDNLRISFRPSPTSSTATTTPTSTAPGSGTHQPVDIQMPRSRNGNSVSGGVPLGKSGGVPCGSATNHNVNNSGSAQPSASVNNFRGETAASGKVAAPRFTAVTQQTLGSVSGVQLTLYGWRKKCLYTVILVLMIMIIINLALTLWILKVMEFSSDGMGQLKIVSGGIQLTGQALVLDILRASSIRSKHGQPISIESSRNFSLNTRDSEGYLENQLFLGHDRLEVLANHFRVADTHGTTLFAVDRDEVSIGATSLRVEGEGGVIFKDSIQTPLVRAEAGKDLKLESPTRSLEVRATQEIFMQSRAGSIEANCLNDLKLHSVAGSIRLDASTILLPNLKTVQPPTSAAGSSGSMRDHIGAGGSSSSSSSSPASSTTYSGHSKIYQLCVCSNGMLFLAPAHSICATDDSAICR
ncbi:uncharacterized protein LOC128746275 [Sabethes cyaneus]|uniref:uncharacterized protein LOC128746275 n=1 Tax=Sabethes cyaneus TaxID=53552 RepID=UPI00237ED6E5|nr:uncharacterized protein LOC128746275 [Sabethes cyaneus]